MWKTLRVYTQFHNYYDDDFYISKQVFFGLTDGDKRILMIFPNIKPYIIISENGVSMGHGNGFMARYESACENRQDGINNLPQGA